MTGETFAITAVISANIAAFKAGVRQVIGESEKLAGFSKLNAAGIGQSFQKVGGGMTKAFTIPFATIGASSVKMFGDFDHNLRSTMAAMGYFSDKNGKFTGQAQKDYEALTKAAKKWGQDSIFSSTEVAEAMDVMASRGLDANQILKSGKGVVDLAAAANIGLSDAADMVGASLQQFSKQGLTSAHVADVVAQSAADTALQGTDLGDAMKYAGTMAGSYNIKFEETAAAIGVMADSGLNAEQSGRYLSMAFQKMAKPTEEARKLMEELGISFFDSDGKMKPLSENVAMLREKLGKLTDEQKGNALATIFGQEAGRGMNTLMEESTGKLENLTSRFNNCEGAANGMADTLNSGIKGSFEQMFESIRNIALSVGEILAPKIKVFADKIRDLAEKFQNLSPEAKKLIVKISGIIAIVGPALLIFGKLISFGSGVKDSIGKLALGFKGLGTKIGNFSSKLNFFPKVFGGLFSSIGQFLGKLATPFVKFGGIVKGVFSAGLGHVKSFLLGFGPIQAITGKVSGLFSALAGKLGLTAAASGEAAGGLAAIGGAVGPLLAVVAVVGFFVAAIKTAWDTSASFRESVKNAIQGVVDSFNNFKSALGDLGAAISPVLGYVKELWSSIVGALTPVFSALAGIIGGVVSGAFSILSGAVGAVAKVFQFLSPAIGPLLSVFSAIAKFIGAILAPVLSGLGMLLGFIGKLFGKLGEKIGEFASWIFDKLAPVIDFIGGALKGVADFIGGITNGIKGFTDKIGLTSSEIEKSNETIAASTENATNRTAQALENIDIHADNTTLKAKQMSNGVSDATALMAQSTQQNVDGMGAGVGNIFDLMSTNALTSTEMMSTGINEILLPMKMQVPEQFQEMATSSILHMQQMGISSIEEADALVSGVGVKWEEMSS